MAGYGFLSGISIGSSKRPVLNTTSSQEQGILPSCRASLTSSRVSARVVCLGPWRGQLALGENVQKPLPVFSARKRIQEAGLQHLPELGEGKTRPPVVRPAVLHSPDDSCFIWSVLSLSRAKFSYSTLIQGNAG